MIVFYLLKNITKTSEGIDYKKTDITDLLIFSSTVKDRDIYWNLDGIVTEFISSYKSGTNKDIKETKYYYNALDPDYKKYLGKKKYNEIRAVITSISLCFDVILPFISTNFIIIYYIYILCHKSSIVYTFLLLNITNTIIFLYFLSNISYSFCLIFSSIILNF